MTHLNVAVGIIRNAGKQIFITRRAATGHMASKLEFPGGKVEPGESPEQGLVRELEEEVGILASDYSLFARKDVQFGERQVTLWFYLVEKWQGEPWGKEGQPGAWIAQSALQPADFPPANQTVIEQLQSAC
ncbi:8-oxo-dGTP diphosphatase MutT [Shimwellia blattae]|uniref:8-oxo-dGTP diphosphatase n=1 Tax=Shimwellia blattae (strain ATCC 29907 / DSM 4481 / JCM 1650 / NBRC 105725 / CDC 9005-74) TaxID=630626 RepID=I2BCR6_SHIBC|nr:8-oxo-dGTP diphosphatase MutT [Shimwellia blattae]AFJ48320.1 mutator MutT protein [Shimwellia blattae DSM 4481 = NBRC 105725]GAB81014.1 8-oxo-dGTPase [Shimwellia blattae DSM 4481 = NBRC 105725]VDY65815.1 8-oxo-dGTP diphosphatase [Shimwellia blattae]VEC25876.1 8-oxo-dGTP diphosphatase [Shimwellia blattae]